MKNKILLVIIVLLVLGIVYINFGRTRYSTSDENQQEEDRGTVKSANDIGSPSTENIQIGLFPQKTKNHQGANIWAASYVLIDRDTFYPLAQKNMDDAVPIASTTKIMTAIIVLENYNLDDIVTISQNAQAQIGSDTFLRAGEKITVRDLLYSLLINSGNDAAMALAEHGTGGLDGFVDKMNAKVRYLGLQNTRFRDPAGLDDSGYSSAHDLAVMAAYSLKNEIFQRIVQIPEITITSVSNIAHELKNSNRLVKGNEALYYPFAKGIKTGFTPEAGHSLVSAAEKDGHFIIGVVLKTQENTIEASAKESKKLLEWGFANYKWL